MGGDAGCCGAGVVVLVLWCWMLGNTNNTQCGLKMLGCKSSK